MDKMRTNGFERPFHPLQVLSWVVFGSDVFLYVFFCIPIIETLAAQVIVGVFYVTSVIVLVFTTAKATNCDPCDPHVRIQDESQLREENESMPYCTMCDRPVFSRSKHCRACNKCVDIFDHHCMWLNNCVGGPNYKWFFGSVSSCAVMIGVILATCVYGIVDYVVNEDFESRIQAIAPFEDFPKEFFLGLLILMTFVNCPLFVLDGQLVLLHAFLMSQNLTTYEYIMNKRSMDFPGSDESKLGRLGRRIRTLPHCMDWIVFARCGKKRRKKSKNGIERIEPAAQAADGHASSGDEAPAASCGDGNGKRVQNRNPSPPGSTVDAEDVPKGDQLSPQRVSPEMEDADRRHGLKAGKAGANGEEALTSPRSHARAPEAAAGQAALAQAEVNGSDQKHIVAEHIVESGQGQDAVEAKLGCGCEGNSSARSKT